MIPRLLLACLPVLAFLLALMWMDSYKLAPPRRIAGALGSGAVVALLCMGINTVLFRLVPHYDWAGAPVVEETLKAAVVWEAVRRGRVGFLVDAGIAGFAVGAGFAFFENVYYAAVLGAANPLVFAVRGFGTAMMHGGATAIVAMLAVRGTPAGLAVAVAAHAIYNAGWLPPVAAAALVLAAMPVLLAAVLAYGEAGLRRWLGEGFDRDLELLAMLGAGRFLETPEGEYIKSLKKHFPPPVVADMLCLIQITLELSLRAKGELMKREAGYSGPLEPAIAGKLEELAWLERSVGATGRRALAPLLGEAQRRAWQLRMLREAM